MRTLADAVPDRVAMETEKRLQAAVLDVLMGRLNSSRAQRAVADYMALCRESRVRLERAA
jgi:hypothetical protein